MKREPFNLLVSMIQDYMKQTIRIPEIQREAKIWSLEQKQNLIDSLYNDFDIPKIYFRKNQSEETTWWLIDGQQRLSTIAEFLNGDFTLSESSTLPERLHNMKYSKLPPNDKEKIIGREKRGSPIRRLLSSEKDFPHQKIADFLYYRTK